MKNITLFIFALFLGVALVSAQVPQSFRYQAVARDNSGNVLANQNVSFRISILSGSISGTEAYSETHTGKSTNAFGLVELEIGKGTPETGTFSSIEWGSNIFFVKVEMDPAGGTAYQLLNTSQLLSVPYALYSQKAGNGFSGNYNDLTNKPLLFDGTWDSLTGKPEGTAAGQMQYWNGSAWVTVAPGVEGQVLTFFGSVPTWKTLVGVGDVIIPSTGTIWMDRNLGAYIRATSSTEYNGYGDLYQWGRATDGHEKRTSGTTSTLSSRDTPGHGDFITNASSPYDWRSPQNDNLWQGVTGTNNPCPSGYRLPTSAEWEAERLSGPIANAADAFGHGLKLPVAGRRQSNNGSLDLADTGGFYWSSTVSGTNSGFLYFGSTNAYMGYSRRALGGSVRCIKE